MNNVTSQINKLSGKGLKKWTMLSVAYCNLNGSMTHKKEGVKRTTSRINISPRQPTQKNSRRRTRFNDPNLVRDLISREQFVDTKHTCRANK